MQKIRALLFSKTTTVFADQAVFSGTNFVLTLFLAQRLGISDFGLFSAIVVFTYLVMGIANALIIQPFQVSMAKIEAKKEYFAFLFALLVGLLVALMLISKLILLFLSDDNAYKINSAAILCFVGGYLFQDFFRKVFLGIDKVRTTTLIDLLFVALLAAGFFTEGNHLTVFETLIIIGVANFISAVPGLLFLSRNIEWPVSWRLFLSMHFGQGKWLLSVSLLQWSSSNFFVLVSGAYLGMEALGALRLVQSFFGIINVALQTVENYFLPKVAYLYHENETAARQLLLKLTVSGALFFGVLLTVLFVFSNEIIVMAGGSKYETYGYLVRIISVLYFFIFLSYPFRIAVRVLVLNKIFFSGYVISFTLSLLTFHFLLKYTALYGAVTGLIINQISMILYWQFQLRKQQFILWK